MTTTQSTEFENPYGGTMRVMQNGLAFYDMEDKPFMFDSPEQACRAALAILAGPGRVERLEVFDDDIPALNAAVNALSEHFAALDARAAAEAEAAELEAEARHLFQTQKNALGWAYDWADEPDEIHDAFREVAREARRLHTNKETQHG
ncbi:hypothetical protein [Arthrobacter woluwensis]|uniref:hypothetical protein n=1 Tax=Arthrobacter woluwensis TaxID=156980 RepID=UPI00119D89FB|nr:hypothetical protein [Arthrobacter woluwensis]